MSISPRSGELFYQRVLLLHRPAYSFSELRTVHNTEYPTFHQAATALGLFNNETEAEQALREAVDFHSSPARLRFLFAQVLLNILTSAVELFRLFQEPLSADYMDQGHPMDQVLPFTLRDIARFLQAGGSSLRNFGLPEPHTVRLNELILEQTFFSDDILDQYRLEADLTYESLNVEQASIFDTIKDTVETSLQGIYNNSEPPLFFVDGKAGRGKTFTLNALCKHLRHKRLSVAVCGSTALSATLYPRGRTAHSLFGIPVTEVSFQPHCTSLQY